MDGIHDLGGREGFGRVDAVPDDPPFHRRWEAAVFAMVNAAARAGAFSNTDQFRHAIERIDPRAYLTHGYYGRWLGALENLLIESGTIDAAAIDAIARRNPAWRSFPGAVQRAARPDPQASRVPPDQQGSDSRREVGRPPLFQIGQRVRTRRDSSAGHTRLPAYARDRIGVVQAWHDGWVYPDRHAHGDGETGEHLYTVSFTGQMLWGARAEPGTQVALDLFEPYLEACDHV